MLLSRGCSSYEKTEYWLVDIPEDGETGNVTKSLTITIFPLTTAALCL
jgi:hypothetical protein